MFLDLPDPQLDPLDTSRVPDPDHSIISKNRKKNLDFYCFLTSYDFFTSVPDPHPVLYHVFGPPGYASKGLDPRIRIRTKMSRIHNTGKNRSKWFGCLR
jgi:hypothetical protein